MTDQAESCDELGENRDLTASEKAPSIEDTRETSIR